MERRIIPQQYPPGSFHVGNHSPSGTRESLTNIQPQITDSSSQPEHSHIGKRDVTASDEILKLIHRVKALKQEGKDSKIRQQLIGEGNLMEKAYQYAANKDFRLLRELISLEQTKETKHFEHLTSHGTWLLYIALNNKEHSVIDWIFSHPKSGKFFVNLSPKNKTIIKNNIWEINSSRFIITVLDSGVLLEDEFKQQLLFYLEQGLWRELDKIHLILQKTLYSTLIVDIIFDALKNNKLPHNQKEEHGQTALWVSLHKKVMYETLHAGGITQLENLIAIFPQITHQNSLNTFRVYGKKIFKQAIQNNCFRVVDSLMRHPGPQGLTDDQDNTPLHQTVIENNETIARVLIQQSNLHEKNQAGLTPFALAQLTGLTWCHILAPTCKDILRQETPVTATPQEPTHSQLPLHSEPELPSLEKEGIEFQLNQALRKNEFLLVGCLHRLLGRFSDEEVQEYGNVTYLIMNDGPRMLLTTYPQFRSYRGAYLHMVNQDSNGTYTKVEPVITGTKPFSPHSKLVIVGHGPNMGQMNGHQFACFLNRWLKDNNCPDDVCPKITLSSCKTADAQAGNDPLIYLFGLMMGFEMDSSFVKDLVSNMASLQRFPQVTATHGIVTAFSDGMEICAVYQQRGDDLYVSKWQGTREWLDPVFALQRGYLNITEDNYDENLVQVYEYNKEWQQVMSHPKHLKPVVGDPQLGGLTSLMPQRRH